MPFTTMWTRSAVSKCGWAFASVTRPCVAHRVWPMPVRVASPPSAGSPWPLALIASRSFSRLPTARTASIRGRPEPRYRRCHTRGIRAFRAPRAAAGVPSGGRRSRRFRTCAFCLQGRVAASNRTGGPRSPVGSSPESESQMLERGAASASKSTITLGSEDGNQAWTGDARRLGGRGVLRADGPPHAAGVPVDHAAVAQRPAVPPVPRAVRWARRPRHAAGRVRPLAQEPGALQHLLREGPDGRRRDGDRGAVRRRPGIHIARREPGSAAGRGPLESLLFLRRGGSRTLGGDRQAGRGRGDGAVPTPADRQALGGRHAPGRQTSCSRRSASALETSRGCGSGSASTLAERSSATSARARSRTSRRSATSSTPPPGSSPPPRPGRSCSPNASTGDSRRARPKQAREWPRSRASASPSPCA